MRQRQVTAGISGFVCLYNPVSAYVRIVPVSLGLGEVFSHC